MKLYLIVFLALALLTVHQQVYASGSYYPPSPPEPPMLITEYKSEGVPSAMAAGQCQFDWTYDLQGCVPVATYDGNAAIGYHMAKRYKKVLFNGGINYEEGGKYSAAGAVNWKFK